jgi:hypothetical protein
MLRTIVLLAFALPAWAAEWPSFRGPNAAGVADGQKLPDSWDATTGANIKWKTVVPGLA